MQLRSKGLKIYYDINLSRISSKILSFLYKRAHFSVIVNIFVKKVWRHANLDLVHQTSQNFHAMRIIIIINIIIVIIINVITVIQCHIDISTIEYLLHSATN